MNCSQPGSSVHSDSPGKNTGIGSRSLLQGIFPNKGLNPGLPHCRQILYHLSQQQSLRDPQTAEPLHCRVSPTGVKVLSICQALEDLTSYASRFETHKTGGNSDFTFKGHMHKSHTLWIQGKGSNSIGAMFRPICLSLRVSWRGVWGSWSSPWGHRHWQQLFLGHWAWTEVLASPIVEPPSSSLAPRSNPTNNL